MGHSLAQRVPDVLDQHVGPQVRGYAVKAAAVHDLDACLLGLVLILLHDLLDPGEFACTPFLGILQFTAWSGDRAWSACARACRPWLGQPAVPEALCMLPMCFWSAHRRLVC